MFSPTVSGVSPRRQDLTLDAGIRGPGPPSMGIIIGMGIGVRRGVPGKAMTDTLCPNIHPLGVTMYSPVDTNVVGGSGVSLGQYIEYQNIWSRFSLPQQHVLQLPPMKLNRATTLLTNSNE